MGCVGDWEWHGLNAACCIPVCCRALLHRRACHTTASCPALPSRHLTHLATTSSHPLQGLLCGMTQVIVQKLSDSDSAKAGVLQVRRPLARGCCRWQAGGLEHWRSASLKHWP